jgi:hypothetical protein
MAEEKSWPVFRDKGSYSAAPDKEGVPPGRMVGAILWTDEGLFEGYKYSVRQRDQTTGQWLWNSYLGSFETVEAALSAFYTPRESKPRILKKR